MTRIPEITNSELERLCRRIRPIVRFVKTEDGLETHPRGEPYHIKRVHPRNSAYTWGPKPLAPARGLAAYYTITTYHSFGYYGFFKPSIAEVLAQIPGEHRERAVAFEIIERPETVADLHREHEALNQGYHVARTRLYERAPKK